jgi:tetratricopeptide (TPR) repeat protein
MDLADGRRAAGSASTDGLDPGSDPMPGGAPPSPWSDLWQVPAILLSTLLIAAGLYVAGQRAPDDDFDGVLGQVEALIAAMELEPAGEQLEMVIRPNLEKATPHQQARYHAVVADWLSASQAGRQVSVHEANRIVADEYALAAELGPVITPARLERWANALIDLGAIEGARERLAEMEAIALTARATDEVRDRRNRLLRRLVERSLRLEDLSFDDTMAVLEDFRDDALIRPIDLAWASARQAELRLEAADAKGAVSHLLVDMRRLEEYDSSLPPEVWGELYRLLARGYFDRGNLEHATFHVEEALRRYEQPVAGRGAAVLLLGRVEQAGGDLQAAHARFDEVVRDYARSDAYLPARLARAEVASILGDHGAAVVDYGAVIDRIAREEPRRDVTPRSVAASLADRHDAGLTVGDLALALQYASLAEILFDPGSVPVDVLSRIASTSRQIADNIMSAALSAAPDGALRYEQIEPAVRRQAAESYERAGDYYLRHARALTAVPDADERWATSLWLAADSFDLAGRRQMAIRHFMEYIAGRPVDDPRRAEVTFRLGQAHEAQLEYEPAARAYDRVIEEHPRGPLGTASHVPLARCYRALGRESEAEDQLVQVVDGRAASDAPVNPDAPDYTSALIELGKLYYETGQYARAIERLTAAVDRYPDDPRINEVRYRLADSSLRLSRTITRELADDATLPPRQRAEREARALAHLESALAGFTQVVEGYAERDERELDLLQRDYQRNAVFSRGDCAYALERYRLAAALYDQAARQYGDHHSSMHALVQIVNCFTMLGELKDADIAHHNALIRLRQLPDEAFTDPRSLMDRDAWERWLQNRPVGRLTGAETASTN